jgi:arsenate reductase
MAAAFFNALADPAKARAISAGTEPADKVHPVVLDTMREENIDLGNARPQKLTVGITEGATLLITMGCGEQCPYVPGLPRADWELEDPKGKPPERVREIRDAIKRRVRDLIASHGWQGTDATLGGP